MRQMFSLLIVAAFCSLSVGCGGPEDGMMEYDAELSAKKSAEYAAQQKAAMENAMKQSKGKGGNPYMRR